MSQTFKHHFTGNFTFFAQILGVLLLCSIALIVLIALYLAYYYHVNLSSFISTLFAHAHNVSPTQLASDPLGGNVVTPWR